ncbi:hypothetical protein Bbelb_075210 [Branchiostoma belcheri]|nr:hypothetical protein Bbelb_075210 [Branchiostoma belcheri]
MTRILQNTFNGLQSLRVLHLFDNKISEIEDGVFKDVRQIKELSLAGNCLTHLSEGSFEGLSQLDTLKLSRNRINTIAPGAFQALVSLRDLQLDNNDLTVIDASAFANPSPIQVLNLTHNRIQVVEAEVIKGMKHLRSLLLSENELLHLPIDLLDELAGNEELKVLELRDNPYRCMCPMPPDQFPSLGNLSPSIWKQVHHGIICVHPPDLSGTPMLNSTIQLPCPPPLVELSNEKKRIIAKGKQAFTCNVYWEEEPVITWLLPGNVVLELPSRGDHQNSTIRFQAPGNISWSVEHTGRNDVSIHEYEDIENNHQNGVWREMNDQNQDRDDNTIHEYEDVDNDHRNGVQTNDLGPEVKDDPRQTEDPFYAAAAEATTYDVLFFFTL